MSRTLRGMGEQEIRRSALRGAVPAVLTVAVVAGGAVGGVTGTGGPAVLVATAVAVAVALAVLAGLVALVGPPDDELAAQWARVEPHWSGRSGAHRPPRPRRRTGRRRAGGEPGDRAGWQG